MRLLIDANIVVSAILGSANRLGRAIERGADIVVVDAQLVEALNVLTRLGFERDQAGQIVAEVVTDAKIIALDDVAQAESVARSRLQERGQSDWPVLAAALSLGVDIWSDDRDFFGVGVVVWSTYNMSHAFPDGANNA